MGSCHSAGPNDETITVAMKNAGFGVICQVIHAKDLSLFKAMHGISFIDLAVDVYSAMRLVAHQGGGK